MENSNKLRMENYDGPPKDDVCPICFGEFQTPCKTNCGHWFCASQCKCPICCCRINKLVPEQSLFLQQEQEVIELLEKVEYYSFLYGGGSQGLFLKVKILLVFIIKWIFHAMWNPENLIVVLRTFAILLTAIYEGFGFNFIPTGGLKIHHIFDDCALILGFLFCIYRTFRR